MLRSSWRHGRWLVELMRDGTITVSSRYENGDNIRQSIKATEPLSIPKGTPQYLRVMMEKARQFHESHFKGD